jgi:iron complex outermembrane receptor protein
VSPTFFLPARTLLGLNAGYTIDKNWKVWLKVDNLADKSFIQASLSRGTLTPGMPRNVAGSVTYRF